jgi:hypothetical protein
MVVRTEFSPPKGDPFNLERGARAGPGRASPETHRDPVRSSGGRWTSVELSMTRPRGAGPTSIRFPLPAKPDPQVRGTARGNRLRLRFGSSFAGPVASRCPPPKVARKTNHPQENGPGKAAGGRFRRTLGGRTRERCESIEPWFETHGRCRARVAPGPVIGSIRCLRTRTR